MACRYPQGDFVDIAEVTRVLVLAEIIYNKDNNKGNSRGRGKIVQQITLSSDQTWTVIGR